MGCPWYLLVRPTQLPSKGQLVTTSPPSDDAACSHEIQTTLPCTVPVCAWKICYGKCPLLTHSHSQAINGLFVCIRHPVSLRLKFIPFLCLLVGHHAGSTFSRAMPPRVLLIPNKSKALELALGGERLRERNVSVSIQAASGSKY